MNTRISHSAHMVQENRHTTRNSDILQLVFVSVVGCTGDKIELHDSARCTRTRETYCHTLVPAQIISLHGEYSYMYIRINMNMHIIFVKFICWAPGRSSTYQGKFVATSLDQPHND